ncbi:hypothetical protein GCM10023238_19870 [Streptomyces heliomycini]
MADAFGDGPVPLTLRVRLSGAPQDGPGYAGESVPSDVFTVTEGDREAAAEGEDAGGDAAFRALAVGGHRHRYRLAGRARCVGAGGSAADRPVSRGLPPAAAVRRA